MSFITIRRKILLVVALTLGSLLLCLQLTAMLVLRNGFSRIEQKEAREDSSRVRGALNDTIAKISSTAGDWAWWDDTYQFVVDRNSNYARSNLGTESIATLHLNAVVLMDSKGKIVFGSGFNFQKNQKVPLPSSLKNQLNSSNPLLKFDRLQDSKQGLLMLPEGLMMVAARSILTSDRQGPSHGTLLFGRFLDDGELSVLSQLTRFPLHLQRLDMPMAAEFQDVRPRLTASHPTEIRAADNDTLWAYTLIQDVYGQPAMILRVALPRQVHHQGEASLGTMFVAVLLACIAFCAVTFWLLEKVVLERLENLDLGVRRITHEHDLKQRIQVSGQDELGALGGTINELLNTIAQSQGNLMESENRFRTFMDNSPAVAFVKNEEGRFVYINVPFEKCFGKSSAEVLGRTDYELWPGSIADTFREHDMEVLQTGKLLQTEELVPDAQNRPAPWLIFKFPLRGGAEKTYLAGMGIDISQRKEVEIQLTKEQAKLAAAIAELEGLNRKLADVNERLERQAMVDELTQLPNRRAFNMQLKTEMDRARRYKTPLSLLLLDIDKFKQINDTWGHPYGDEVLQKVAVALQSALRSTDFAARYGGEEMAVILPNTPAEGALITAERCRKFIEETQWLHRQITASFGASTFRDGMETTAFIAAADAALYTSKNAGRNRSTHVDALELPAETSNP